MKITDCEDFSVPVIGSFISKYQITDNNVLSNTIEVYGLNNKAIDKKVAFEVKNIADILTVYPIDNYYEEYMIRYFKLVNAKKIEINKEDIIEHFELSDNHVFYVQEGEINNDKL